MFFCFLGFFAFQSLAASTWFLSLDIFKGYSHFWNVLGVRSSNRKKRNIKNGKKSLKREEQLKTIQIFLSRISILKSVLLPREIPPPLLSTAMFFQAFSALWKIKKFTLDWVLSALRGIFCYLATCGICVAIRVSAKWHVTTEKPGGAAEVAGPWGVGELPYQVRGFLRMLFITHRGPILKISRNRHLNNIYGGFRVSYFFC